MGAKGSADLDIGGVAIRFGRDDSGLGRVAFRGPSARVQEMLPRHWQTSNRSRGLCAGPQLITELEFGWGGQS